MKGPARVIDDHGKMGDANKEVINALIKADRLFARGRLKHSYPHSWRSKSRSFSVIHHNGLFQWIKTWETVQLYAVVL